MSSEHIVVYDVITTSWKDLSRKHGELDIEGSEPPFLSGMIGANDLPAYISSELMNLEPIRLFAEIEYDRFRLINQLKHVDFPVHNPLLEGFLVTDINNHHLIWLFWEGTS